MHFYNFDNKQIFFAFIEHNGKYESNKFNKVPFNFIIMAPIWKRLEKEISIICLSLSQEENNGRDRLSLMKLIKFNLNLIITSTIMFGCHSFTPLA